MKEKKDKLIKRNKKKNFLTQKKNLFKAITKIEKRPKFDVPTFLGKINPEELINWINELEEYFEYEEIENLDRVKFAKEKLKGQVKIWWQEVQLDQNNRGQEKITKWERMVAKLKWKFIPIDYEFNMLKKMQVLEEKVHK